MIRSLLPALLLGLLASGNASAAHYLVYLLGGQSNGNGRADAAQLTAPLDAPQTDVFFYWHRTQSVNNVGHIPEDQWTDLAPGSGHGTGAPVYPKEFGSEVSFGRAMADAKPSQNVAIIKYTHGGSNLYSNWAAGGSRYTSFVSTVQAGLAALTTAGHTYELRGMLWQQGESDTGGSNADNYAANLTNLISRVRSDVFGGGPLPFVLGSLSNSQYGNITTPGSGPYKVRQAQETVAAADPAVGIVITDGYETRTGDAIHFNARAQVALGQNFATQMLSLEGPDETAPDITTTNPADDTGGVATGANLVATFNETIALVDGGTLTIRDLGPGADVVITLPDARVSVSGTDLIINPSADLAVQNPYAIRISSDAVSDLATTPNFFAGIADDTTWNFTTFLPANSIGSTGVFDENINATNQLDVELAIGTLAPFQAAVQDAYANDLGGVIDWETGVTASPSSGPTAGNKLTGTYGIEYGAGATSALTITFDRSMDLYTNDINNQVSVLSQQGAFHNALIPSGGNDPVGLAYTITFSGADIIELGAAIPSRSTYSTLGVDFRATASFSGGGTAVSDFNVGGTKGTGDVFLRFAAPGGEAITSLAVAYLDDNGQGLTNGQRRPILDDLGFVVAPTVETFASWISNAAFGLALSEQGFDDDPDGDSLSNGLEAWFGTHPGEFTEGLVGLATNGTTSSFTHPQNEAPVSDLAGIYQWSPNLRDWFAGDGAEGPPGGPTVTISSDTVEGTTSVTTTASGPQEKLFLRVAVLN